MGALILVFKGHWQTMYLLGAIAFTNRRIVQQTIALHVIRQVEVQGSNK